MINILAKTTTSLLRGMAYHYLKFVMLPEIVLQENGIKTGVGNEIMR